MNLSDDTIRTKAHKRILLFSPFTFSPTPTPSPIPTSNPYPPLLIIHLKRLLAFTKLQTPISFPLHLPMEQWCQESGCVFQSTISSSSSLEDKPKVTYSLSAVVVHHGGSYGGHYIAYVKRPVLHQGTADTGEEEETSNKMKYSWFYTSDASTSVASEQSVKQQEGYILFYERDDHAIHQEQEYQEQEYQEQEHQEEKSETF